MLRITFLLLVSMLAGLPGDLEKTESATPAEFVWRAEYQRAVSATGAARERATYLMMAGDEPEAFDQLGFAADLFERGVVAYKAGRYAESLDLTGEPNDNAYLEGYRLYYRAASQFELGDHAEAVSECERFFALISDTTLLEEHPVLIDAKNLYAEAFARSPLHDPPLPGDFDFSEITTSRAFLILAMAYHDKGLDEQARNLFLECAEAEIDTSTALLFTEMMRKVAGRLHEFDMEELVTLTRFALKIRNREAANIMMKHLLEHCGNDHTVRLVKGRHLASTGEKRKAIRIYRSIFNSDAPVALKKNALLEKAALEHAMKRYEDAAQSYRTFGMYYPGDSRSARSLDIAARLEVARNKWDRALAIWEVLRQRGCSSSIHREAALSEAVLLHTMGKTAESHMILEQLLPDTGGLIEASTLYWLQLTSPDENDRDTWSKRLIDRYPESFYARVLREGEKSAVSLSANGARGDQWPLILAMESCERVSYDSAVSGISCNGSQLDHPAYGAFDYFMSIGALAEAADCADVLKILFGRNRELMSLLYRDARAAGMADVALSILNSPAFFSARSRLLRKLYYPVTFSNTISENAAERRIPVDLILAVIREESRFDSRAVSRAGAIGLMQLMPSTGAWIGAKLGVQNISDVDFRTPEFNIGAGSWYLRFHLDRSGENLVAALAAYNAGRSRMQKWRTLFTPERSPMAALEMIGIRETRNYVRRVLDSMAAYRSIYDIRTEHQ